MGQEEATEGLGTGNDDLNYLITHHIGLVVSSPQLPRFVIILYYLYNMIFSDLPPYFLFVGGTKNHRPGKIF